MVVFVVIVTTVAEVQYRLAELLVRIGWQGTGQIDDFDDIEIGKGHRRVALSVVRRG